LARYRGKVSRIYFRAGAGFASPDVDEYLEREGIKYAIRLPANRASCRKRIGYLLKRLLAAPPLMSGVPMRTLPIRREAGRSRVASSPRSNRIKAISEGYDLTIGIMHEDSDGSSKCIFNGAGAAQCRSRGVGFRPRQHFRSGGSVTRTDGVCRLSSQLARMVMARCRNRKSTAGRPEST
jgi:hypothetical protein